MKLPVPPLLVIAALWAGPSLRLSTPALRLWLRLALVVSSTPPGNALTTSVTPWSLRR